MLLPLINTPAPTPSRPPLCTPPGLVESLSVIEFLILHFHKNGLKSVCRPGPGEGSGGRVAQRRGRQPDCIPFPIDFASTPPPSRLLLVLLRLAKSRPSGGCSLVLCLRALILATQEKYITAPGSCDFPFTERYPFSQMGMLCAGGKYALPFLLTFYIM